MRLIISDHLPWDLEKKMASDHMFKLQEKVNLYLSYIEGGQLVQDYPESGGFDLVIQVYGKFDRTKDAVHFYDQLKNALKDAGYCLEFILKD